MRKIVFAVLLFHAVFSLHAKRAAILHRYRSGFSINSWDVDGITNQTDNKGTSVNPGIRLYFPVAIDRASVASAIALHTAGYNLNYQNDDSILVIQPKSALSYLSNYMLTVNNTLKSKSGGKLIFPVEIKLQTRYDPSYKFPVISDSALR